MSQGVEHRFRDPLYRPEDVGVLGPSPSRAEEAGMVVDRDVAIPLRDGVRIYADVLRPTGEEPVPALLAWSPYGKHEGTLQYLVRAFPGAGVSEEDVSPYAVFEGPDPAFWVPRGYAVVNVNPRGTWYSEGIATFHSPEEAEDCYDVIEWIAAQPWCLGRVGMTGVSYLTVIQWYVAALHPPHLAAINPWEGYSDLYREVSTHGGIPETWFRPYWTLQRVTVGTQAMEDLFTEDLEHPLFDEFWESKLPHLDKISVPAYVVASWSDHGFHTRGTIEGFKRIRSEHKWLEVHGEKKWAYYYAESSRQRQAAFFDHFLKGRDTEVSTWPRVRTFVREHGTDGEWKSFGTWPITRTSYTRLYLDPRTQQLKEEQVPEESCRWYLALSGGYDRMRRELGRATFDYHFTQTVDVIGHMRLRVWMATPDGDDMDVFVGIQKMDQEGRVVPFAHYAQYEDGPVALGWLRASHRELDLARTTEWQPVHTHRRELKLQPGEIVPLDIEIWASGTRFRPGESLRLIIQGRDVQDYPSSRPYARHEVTVNRGRHFLWGGGRYDSYLVVPVVE